MEDTQFDALIESADWRKTTYIKPHQYVMRATDTALFDELGVRIREQAVRAVFLNRVYRYYNYKGWRYWTYKILCNRAEGEVGEGEILA